MRQILLSFLKAPVGLWLDEKKKGEKGRREKKNFSIQPLDLHVEALMGVRCAPNQRNMAGNVSEPEQGGMGLQEL